MTPDQARDLAARTTRKIKALRDGGVRWDILDADQERVASDLAGLRKHYVMCCGGENCELGDAARYADGLRRTARLYGLTE